MRTRYYLGVVGVLGILACFGCADGKRARDEVAESKKAQGGVKVETIGKEVLVVGGVPCLVIKVSVVNINPVKKVEYLPWTNADVTLKDDLGNTYRHLVRVGHHRPLEVGKPVVCYPDKPESDILLFEAPLDTATYLDLELSAVNYGGTGVNKFRLPTKEITGTKAYLAAETAKREKELAALKAQERVESAKMEREKAAADAKERELRIVEEARERERQSADAERREKERIEEAKHREEKERLRAANEKEKAAREAERQELARMATAHPRYLKLMAKGRQMTERKMYLEAYDVFQQALDLKGGLDGDLLPRRTQGREAFEAMKEAKDAGKELVEQKATALLEYAKGMVSYDRTARLREVAEKYPGTRAALEAKELLKK
jgi:hypothetical protein